MRSRFLVEEPEGKRELGRSICKCVDIVSHRSSMGGFGLEPGTGQAPLEGCCEQSYEILESVKRGGFLD
jgi:hypothetical protein